MNSNALEIHNDGDIHACRYGLEDTPESTYTGMFFEGQKHGYGVEERGELCYRGNWNHGVRHGWGDLVVRGVEYRDKKSLFGKHRVSEIKVRAYHYGC